MPCAGKGAVRGRVVSAVLHFVVSQAMPKRIANGLKALGRDESGGEVIEYALVLGLIIVVCIAVITSFGSKVLARWQSVNSSM